MNKILVATFVRMDEKDDGTVAIEGVASTEAVDSAGEIVLASAIKAALPEFKKYPSLREMHQPIAAGRVDSITVGTDGKTYIKATVVDSNVVRKVKAGVLRALSIGGKVLARDSKDPKIITGLSLSEASLVDTPANRDCSTTAVKTDVAVLWKADLPTIQVGPSAEDVKAVLGAMTPEERALLLAKCVLKFPRQITTAMPWRS